MPIIIYSLWCNVVGDDQLNIGYSGKKLVSFEYILILGREHERYLGFYITNK